MATRRCSGCAAHRSRACSISISRSAARLTIRLLLEPRLLHPQHDQSDRLVMDLSAQARKAEDDEACLAHLPVDDLGAGAGLVAIADKLPRPQVLATQHARLSRGRHAAPPIAASARIRWTSALTSLPTIRG